MAENHRPTGKDVVDVRISIQIIKPGALGSLDKSGLPADRSEGADQAIDPPGDEFLGLLKQLDRLSDFHNGRAPYHAETGRSRKWRGRNRLAANCLT